MPSATPLEFTPLYIVAHQPPCYNEPMDEQNPVLLQISGKWHIVEHSRHANTTLCGQKVTHRGAHARLSLVGQRNVCPKCLEIFNHVRSMPNNQ